MRSVLSVSKSTQDPCGSKVTRTGASHNIPNNTQANKQQQDEDKTGFWWHSRKDAPAEICETIDKQKQHICVGNIVCTGSRFFAEGRVLPLNIALTHGDK